MRLVFETFALFRQGDVDAAFILGAAAALHQARDLHPFQQRRERVGLQGQHSPQFPNGLAGVVSPRGDVSERGAARFFRRTGEGVYDMADLARRTEAMAGYVAEHKARHPESPVYGFGYSNGANILASVSMARPDLFDRIGLLHPLIPWTPEPVPALAGTRVLITAGQRDPIGPWPMTERLIGWYADQGAEVATEIHDGGHELRQAELLALQTMLAGA